MKAKENNVESEFAIVQNLLTSDNRSRCVDAFALAILKTERQTRRLFTYLAFQADCFQLADASILRCKLASHRYFDFSSGIAGINLLSPVNVSELIGSQYQELIVSLARTKQIRNKLFHGQITTEGLSRQKIGALINSLQIWTTCLAGSGNFQLGYDGFKFNSSYTKNPDKNFHLTLKQNLTNIEDYDNLIKQAHVNGKELFKNLF